MIVAMAGALWVALVASIAALVSAILAPLTNWVVATAAHRHEREMRLREDKIRAYTSVLRECRRRVLVIQEAVKVLRRDDNDDEIEIPEPLALDLGKWLDESSLTMAVQSDDVGAELNEFEKFVTAFMELDASGIDDPATRPGVLVALEVIKNGMELRYHELAKAIRRELAA